MKKFIAVACLVLVLAGLLVTRALTDGCSPTDITITSVTGGTGQATVSGTFNVGSGYTFSSIQVHLRPSGDGAGAGGEDTATVPMPNNFSDTLPVPSGTYSAQAVLSMTNNSDGTAAYFYSDSVAVVVSSTTTPTRK